MGFLGPLIDILMVSIAFMIPPAPDLILVAAAGMGFGPFFGTAYTMVGALFGATANYYLSRRFGRPLLGRHQGKKRIRPIDSFVAKMGWGLLFVCRLVPGFNFSFFSFAAGLTKISLAAFFSATFSGSRPLILIVTTWGQALPGRPMLFLLGVAGIMLLTLVVRAALRSKHFAAHDRTERRET